MLTAKVESLSIAFSFEGRRFVHFHSANGVFCHVRLDSSNPQNAPLYYPRRETHVQPALLNHHKRRMQCPQVLGSSVG
jgi:hypothetical protein